jgi:folylpolyglutamate synthase/dihydropteroate synthase
MGNPLRGNAYRLVEQALEAAKNAAGEADSVLVIGSIFVLAGVL